MAWSYGDFAYIDGIWEDWKKEHNGNGSYDSVLNFVESECTQDFTFGEQDEIIDYSECIVEGVTVCHVI